MMTGGFGNLAGYLFTGALLALCETYGDVDWTRYWLVLNGLVLLVLAFFAISYRDKSILK